MCRFKITQEQCLLITKKKSKIGFLGIAYSDITLSEEAFENIFRKELELKGFGTLILHHFQDKNGLRESI